MQVTWEASEAWHHQLELHHNAIVATARRRTSKRQQEHRRRRARHVSRTPRTQQRAAYATSKRTRQKKRIHDRIEKGVQENTLVCKLAEANQEDHTVVFNDDDFDDYNNNNWGIDALLSAASECKYYAKRVYDPRRP